MALITNIVAYWKLDESSGNASDSTAGARTLTNTGTASYAAGLINNGIDLGTTNTTKWLNYGTDNLGIDGGAITISGWVNINTQISSGFQTLFAQGSTNTFTCNYVEYEYNAGTRRLDFYREKGAVGTEGPTYNITLTPGTWYHVVYTYDGTNVRGYVNGSLVAGPTAASGSGSSVMTNGLGIGDRFYAGSALGNKISAKLDEVGVWSRALSGAEITSLYNGGIGVQYPFGTAYTLALAFNAFTFTGNSVNLLSARNLAIALGTFTLTGFNLLFAMGKGMVVDSASFVLTGFDVLLSSVRTMALATTSFAFTGFSLLFAIGHVLTVEAASFVFTAFSVLFNFTGWTKVAKDDGQGWTRVPRN